MEAREAGRSTTSFGSKTAVSSAHFMGFPVSRTAPQGFASQEDARRAPWALFEAPAAQARGQNVIEHSPTWHGNVQTPKARLRLARKAQPCESILQAFRKGKAFPHKEAAEPQSALWFKVTNSG